MLPPLVLISHWTVSDAGLPVAAAVKVTLLPAITVRLAGSLVIETESTVRFEAVVLAVASAGVKTASYS